ncbi:hypothetical protein EDD93_7633 [Streptomyces sp. 840.1]|nr:hypothetical protein EDD93_7633 [Streptomyces sp. 840.1]
MRAHQSRGRSRRAFLRPAAPSPSRRPRCTVMGVPKTSSRTFTGNGVESSTTTRPGREATTAPGRRRYGGGRADVPLAGLTRPEPLPPYPRQLRPVRHPHHTAREHLPHILMDQPLPRRHADPRPAQTLLVQRPDRLLHLGCHRGSTTGPASPPPIGQPDQPVIPMPGGHPLQRAFAQRFQSESRSFEFRQPAGPADFGPAAFADTGRHGTERRPGPARPGPAAAAAAKSALDSGVCASSGFGRLPAQSGLGSGRPAVHRH